MTVDVQDERATTAVGTDTMLLVMVCVLALVGLAGLVAMTG